MSSIIVPLLTQLTLRNFRCFENFSWEPQPGLNFIIGPNAQGKTSLLEAACILLRLKSPSTRVLQEAIHFGKEAFTLEGTYAGRDMGVRVAPQESSKRLLSLDGIAPQETNDYLATGHVVWFSGEDREIVNGPGERRRRFLDSAGLQLSHDYRHHLKFYDRALRSRNMLLRRRQPRREVEAYDALLAESGETLIRLRTILCEKLAPRAQAACRNISGEELTLTYKPGATLPMFEALKSEVAKNQEIERGFTPVGPHRDEFLLGLNAIPAATFASEGQRRTIALALKLAMATLLYDHRSIPPLLLLDDIFGELDAKRREALLLSIPKGSQALFTTTQLDRKETPDAVTFFEL